MHCFHFTHNAPQSAKPAEMALCARENFNRFLLTSAKHDTSTLRNTAANNIHKPARLHMNIRTYCVGLRAGVHVVPTISVSAAAAALRPTGLRRQPLLLPISSPIRHSKNAANRHDATETPTEQSPCLFRRPQSIVDGRQPLRRTHAHTNKKNRSTGSGIDIPPAQTR